ncbi:MAG: peptidylprolyl isomerase [Terrimonas sp.]|nr:peptidylprolyl isomerase [Terrimonas sp.]
MKRTALFLCFLLITLFSFAQQYKVVADKILGVVGDRVILFSDIKNTIDDAKRQGREIPEGAECSIMEQALVSKVLMLQAEKDSLPVSDEDVEADLDQRVRMFIRQYGSQQVLEEIAGKTIYQIKDEARESVRENKLAEAMQRKIVENVHITPNEVKAYYEKIPKDSLPFFESELEICQIIMYPKANRDLEKYIVDELNNYKRQVELKITSFDQLAKRYSEDPGSKDRGGEYQLNRNEKGTWDPAFLAMAFRLKPGEISAPFKSKFGYHIMQLVERNGDDAIVRHILRIPVPTDGEIQETVNKLDTVRSKIIAGNTAFAEAASKYSEDEAAKFQGPCVLGRDGSTYVTIDQLDKDLVLMLDKMKVGEYSQPVVYDDNGKKAVRIVYYKSRSEPHRLNLQDDYNKIAQAALEEKKQQEVENWLMKKIPSYYIMLADEIQSCEQIRKWADASSQKSF